MLIEIELNRIKVKKELPSSWQEVTFKQFLKLSECGSDYVKIFALFLGIEEETIRKAKIYGLEAVLISLNFLNTQPDLAIPDSILGHQIPKDLGFETIGQLMDLKEDTKNTQDLTPIQKLERYTVYCAMYALKPYDWKKAEEMAPEFLNAPAPEVLSVGHFTLMKLIGLTASTKQLSQKRSPRFKRYRQGLRVWLRNTEVMARYYLWRRTKA